MRHFTTTILLLTLSLITKAQKDSFWLRNLNLMGEPKAVFALDDGYSLVLADSFDQISQQYKGIIFFKLDPNGKTVERKQLFKLDTAFIEQRLEQAEKVRDGYLFRWYYTYHKNDSIINSKSYFAKIDGNGDELHNSKSKINYFGTNGVYWWCLNNDTVIDLPFYQNPNIIRYSLASNGEIFDSIPKVNFSWLLAKSENTLLYGDVKRIQDENDSIWVVRTNWKYDTLLVKHKIFSGQYRIRVDNFTKISLNGYTLLCGDNSIINTDTNLNILWQAPTEFVNANIRPSVKDIQILKNGDILVIADADNLFARVPYISRISADGKVNYFKYHYPSPLDKFYDFDEGPNGEFFLLSGSRLNQSADSVWLIKTSRFGRTVSITPPLVNNEFFSLYPNPAQSQLNVKFGRPTKGNLIIYNSAGKVALTKQFGRQNQLQIDLSQLPSGNYVLKIVNRKGDVYSQLFNH